MIEAHNLWKVFRVYHDPKDRLKEIFLRKRYSREFTALRDVSFEVGEGKTLGIIGENGAGKSTLLKILTGILLPTKGSVRVDGHVTGLLELGTGFNLELSGLDNIYMNGLLIGMNRPEIARKRDSIADFAELGEFISEPIKIYSSGMLMRLAFSIAIHAEPRAFVVDEALSVGDAYFQQKCVRRLKEFKDTGGSIIFVSHDMNAVKMLCDAAILLHKGSVMEQGDPEHVVNRYNFAIARLSDSGRQVYTETGEGHSYGTFEARITDVSVRGQNSGSDVISSGEHAHIGVAIESASDLDDITVGILIRDRYGQDIFGTNTYHHKLTINLKKGKRYRCTFRMRMDIAPGTYTITAALHREATHFKDCFHWVDRAATFTVAGNYGQSYLGLCKLYPSIEVAMVDARS
jgi:lipopolysaccharide transport system ATP-binding protein